MVSGASSSSASLSLAVVSTSSSSPSSSSSSTQTPQFPSKRMLVLYSLFLITFIVLVVLLIQVTNAPSSFGLLSFREDSRLVFSASLVLSQLCSPYDERAKEFTAIKALEEMSLHDELSSEASYPTPQHRFLLYEFSRETNDHSTTTSSLFDKVWFSRCSIPSDSPT